MDADDGNSLPAIGFLTALEDATHGWFGGYLILSPLGRPLEFHCSTPVLPSRAQKILYGPTLRPYLLGEVIGQVLLQRAELPVQAVLTDLPEMLSLALLHDGPVACLETPLEMPGSSQRDDHESTPTVEIAGMRLIGTSTCNWNPTDLHQQLAPLADHVQLLEPFERIREAILEVQRISDHPVDEDHEQSAAA